MGCGVGSVQAVARNIIQLCTLGLRLREKRTNCDPGHLLLALCRWFPLATPLVRPSGASGRFQPFNLCYATGNTVR